MAQKKEYLDVDSRNIYELCFGSRDRIQIIKNNIVTKVEKISSTGKSKTIERKIMRYSPHATSIWKEEQVGQLQIVPVIIEGERILSKNEDMLLEFLDRHPHNEANGGSVFRKRNLTSTAKSSVDAEDYIIDVKHTISSMLKNENKSEEIREIGRAMGYVSAEYSDTDILKKDLYDFVGNSYERARTLSDKFNDPITKAISNIKVAVKDGYILYSTKNNTVKWAGSDQPITVIPNGKEWVKHFAAFVCSPKGITIKEELDKLSNQ